MEDRLPPAAAREILTAYALWGDSGGGIPDRPSLLVDNLTLRRFDDLFLFEADHLTASGRGLKYLDADSVWVGPDDKMPQSITFDWKAADKSALHNMCIQGIDGKCMIWNAALNFPGPDTRGYLSIDNQTLVLPLKKADVGPIHILHLFGGSFGGWTFATQLLNEMEVDIVSGSIEVDFKAARSYALSHRCPLLSAERELPPMALHSFKEGWCIHGDVMDTNWMQAVACWAPEVITISAPCPPWSGASSQKGLHTTEGQLFMRSIGLCKLLRPKIILIEQVAGFHSHPHRLWIEKALWFSGYQLRFSRVIDLGDVMPVRRLRWLGVAYFIHEEGLQMTSISSWSIARKISVMELDCLRSWPQEVLDQLAVPDSALRQAREHPLDRSTKRQKRDTAEEAYESHIFRATSCSLPTFMAQYGKQHQLHPDLLDSKGYFAHWFQPAESDVLRFWHPLEVALIHGAWSGIWMGHDLHLEWKGLGNQIAIPHALWLLVQGINMLESRDFRLSWEDVWEFFDGHRLKASQLHAEIYPSGTMWMDQSARFLLHEDLIQQLFRVGYDHLPSNTFWTPELGITPLQGFLDDGEPVLEIPCLKPWTPHAIQVTQHESLEQTLPIQVLLRCRIMFEGTTKMFQVEQNTPLAALQALWKSSLRHESESEQLEDQDRFFPLAEPSRDCPGDSGGWCIPVMQQADVDMRFVPKEELVQSLLSSEEQERLWHDQFDLVPLRSHILPEMVLSLHGWSHARLSLTSQQILQEATAVNCAYHWKHAADTHILHGVGEHQSCAIWATLWEEAITTEGRATFNLLITPSVQEGSFMIKAQLRSMVPLPPAQFMLWWAVRAVRSTLDCIKVSEGVFVALKWCKRLLWEGHLAPELGFDQLLALLQQLWNPVVDSEELRLIHGFSASRILPEQKLGHLRHMDQRGHAYVLHILTRIQGGGSGGKNPETVAVKNEIASILLDLQYDIAWVSKTVDTLFRHIGFNAAAAFLRGNDGSKGRGILQAIESVGVDLPRKRSGAQDSQSSSRLAQVQKKRAPQIDLSGVTIMKGFIVNEDGSEATQMQSFVPQSSGVMLAHLEQALPWIRENVVLSKDELGIIVVTQSSLDTSLKHQTVTVPCAIPGGEAIILAGILIQFGEKQLRCAEGVHKTTNPACCSIAFTLWREDWNSEEWGQLLDATTPFIVNAFNQAGCVQMILSTWGRSLRHRGKAVAASQATSVQLHGSTMPEHLITILQASGFNKIFCTPKNESGRQDLRFRIVWIDGDLPRLTTLSKQTSGCIGLVKGRTGMGLRFRQEDFSEAWKIICPAKEVPPELQGATWYKVQPLPYGTSRDMLLQWAKAYRWTIQPIRQVGATAWLIASAEAVPEGILLFNSSPVLVKALQPKTKASQSPVVAGDVKISPTTLGASVAAPIPNDPWAQYLATQGRSVPAVGNARSVTGPTETKFKEQEGKLHALEVRLASIEASSSSFQTETQKQISTLDTNIRQQSHDMQNRFHSMGLRFEEHQKEVALQLQNTAQALEASVIKTMKTENQAIHGTLAALQQMFQENLGRKKPKESAE